MINIDYDNGLLVWHRMKRNSSDFLFLQSYNSTLKSKFIRVRMFFMLTKTILSCIESSFTLVKRVVTVVSVSHQWLRVRVRCLVHVLHFLVIFVHIGPLSNEEVNEVLSHEGLLIVVQGFRRGWWGVLWVIVGEVGLGIFRVLLVIVHLGVLVFWLATLIVVWPGTRVWTNSI